MLCTVFAPILAITVVMGTNIKKAGMFKKPKLKGILAFNKLPDTKNPTAPKSAIKNQ